MHFWKLHGAGNDFILFDDRSQTIQEYGALAKAVCDRHFGIGADGMMAVGLSNQADVHMHFYNADGSAASMCGNGIRCFAKYANDSGIVPQPTFTVATGDGVKTVSITEPSEAVSLIEVDMGTFRNVRVFDAPPFALSAKTVFMHCGVPHTMLFLSEAHDLSGADPTFGEAWFALTEKFGPEIEKDPLFAEGTNVNFVVQSGDDSLMVSTWERGAGRTLACGTGACASAAAAHLLGLTGPRVRVRMPGGEVTITLAADGAVTMQGEARLICKGEYYGS